MRHGPPLVDGWSGGGVNYPFSDRQLRKILKRVDKQRIGGILSVRRVNVRPVHIIEYALPDDEEFVCGLLTCEFRGWVERFGDEIPRQNIPSGEVMWGESWRITQAGRAVLDRTQTISNVALVVAIASLLCSIATGLLAYRH
jgi:hypothetical protein